MNASNKVKGVSGSDLSFGWRIVLILLAALLIFVGPTYVPYLLVDFLKLNYFVSIGLGTVLLVVGLVLVWYLIRKKVIE
jgi:hypothetical protein